MYLIKSGNMVIYDSTDKDTYPVLSPTLEEELNGAGSLSFTVLPGHPYYDQMKEMQTFITAYRDNEEIFYGRILSITTSIDGQLEVKCEGGLTFFLDSEMSKHTYNETCQTFLTTILNNHNSMVESQKHFSLGTINVQKALEVDEKTQTTKKWEFKVGGFASTKSVLESLVLGQFGGFFRIRPDGNGGHLLDYIENYGRTNTQPVQIGHNIVNKSDTVSGEGMFTILRPIYGKNQTISGLTQADVTLPDVTIDGEFLKLDAMIAKYGKIYHTESFEKDKIEKKKDCLKAAEKFIQKQGNQLPASTEIGFVDFYHLNNYDYLDITPENHNAWSFYGIPNSLETDTRYTFSINGSTTYSYELWLSTNEQTTTKLAGPLTGGESVIFTTPSSMSEEYLVLSGSESGAGNESLNNIAPQVIKTIDDIRLGDTFTNIEGFSGVTLTVGSISLDMENPGNDTMTLKNQEELNSSGVTSNSLTIIESKYARQEMWHYTYISEEVDDINGTLSLHAPLIQLNANNIETLSQNTNIVLQRKEGSTSEFKLVALDYDEDPLNPGQYVPTIKMNINGTEISDGYIVNEDGEKLAGKASLTVVDDSVKAEIRRATGAESDIISRLSVTEDDISGIVGDIEEINDTMGDLEVSYTNITGSELWIDRDSITALNGKFEIDQNGNLHVVDGAGLMIDRGQASFGVYDSDSLTAGIIVNKVNNGTVSINAAKINLNGETVADAINANSASITDITSNGLTNVNYIIATTGVFSGLTIAGETAEWHTLNWNMGMDSTSVIAYKNIRLGHYHTFSVTESNGVVSLSLGIPTTTDPGTQTFNIADTAFYQQAVSAAHAAGVQEGAASMSVDSISAGITSVSSITYNGSNLSVPLTLTAYHDDGGSGSIVGNDTQSLTVPSRVSSTTTITYDSSTHTYYAASTSKILEVTAATSDATSSNRAYLDGKDDYGFVNGCTVTQGNYSADYSSKSINVVATTPSGSGYEWDQDYNIDTSGAYSAGEASVTISGVTGGTPTLSGNTYTVPLTATASNSATGTGSATVDASARYTAGQNSIKMAKSWSGATATISRTTASSGTVNNIALTVGATAGISYNSSAHTYTASAVASCDGANRASNTTNSGTEAYDAGVTQGEANKAPSSWWAGSSYFSLRNQATRTFSTNITCQRADGTQVRWNYQFTVTAGD